MKCRDRENTNRKRNECNKRANNKQAAPHNSFESVQQIEVAFWAATTATTSMAFALPDRSGVCAPKNILTRNPVYYTLATYFSYWTSAVDSFESAQLGELANGFNGPRGNEVLSVLSLPINFVRIYSRSCPAGGRIQEQNTNIKFVSVLLRPVLEH